MVVIINIINIDIVFFLMKLLFLNINVEKYLFVFWEYSKNIDLINLEGGIIMPGGDRTGPAGMGPMTGRAAGYCAGYPVPGYMNPVPGYGFGRGLGRGFRRGLGFRGSRGRGGYWGAPYGAAAYDYSAPYQVPPDYYTAPYGVSPSPEQEMDALKGQAEYFEDALDGIKKRIQELEAKKEQK